VSFIGVSDEKSDDLKPLSRKKWKMVVMRAENFQILFLKEITGESKDSLKKCSQFTVDGSQFCLKSLNLSGSFHK
jgi:hypothetical protein